MARRNAVRRRPGRCAKYEIFPSFTLPGTARVLIDTGPLPGKKTTSRRIGSVRRKTGCGARAARKTLEHR
jgi:hypothetical protein